MSQDVAKVREVHEAPSWHTLPRSNSGCLRTRASPPKMPRTSHSPAAGARREKASCCNAGKVVIVEQYSKQGKVQALK
jgi:hypothetical protein